MTQTTLPGSVIYRADSRPRKANCWRCSGLEKYWPQGKQSLAIACKVCAGVGLDAMPWTELFGIYQSEGRYKPAQKWQKIKRRRDA